MTEKLEALAAMPVKPGAPKLPGPAIDEAFRTLAGWALADGALEKMFRFADWRATMAFVNAVSDVANEVDHHPDLELGWGRVAITIWTHKIDGLTESDFVLAAKCDRELAAG